MTRKTNLRLPSKLALATIVATGMAAAPAALNPDFALQLNAAKADNGYAAEQAEKTMTPEPLTEENVYRILGTTRDEVQQEITATGTYTQTGPLAKYQHEVESGNLEGAAEVLAAVSNRPITENLVDEVNRELGVETRLTAHQIANTAAEKQDLAAGDMEQKAAFMVPADTADNVYELLGTTREEAESDMIQARPSTQSGPLEEYQHAVEIGNLDRAAEALAAVSNVPITEGLVNDVNLELGVETRLTVNQVAEAASEARMNN